jgi:hypothetical protein
LRGAGRAGRKPTLTHEQLAEVDQALARGAEANGYTTDLWTLPRVAKVIERVAGSPTTRGMSGTSCATSWAGPGSGQRAERSNATMKLSSSGSRSAGHD